MHSAALQNAEIFMLKEPSCMRTEEKEPSCQIKSDLKTLGATHSAAQNSEIFTLREPSCMSNK
jgi:hypothetical protein